MGTQYVHEPFEGIPGFTIISVGSPVTLTLNQMSSGRLFNGSIGKVVDIVFANGHGPSQCGTSWPLYILVKFPDFEGPRLISSRPCIVPIIPVERGSAKAGRKGFPLKLAYTMTCHKAQVFPVSPLPPGIQF
jgi:ATP-dependent exoDNAse (exonuclease V) alpha subunit